MSSVAACHTVKHTMFMHARELLAEHAAVQGAVHVCEPVLATWDSRLMMQLLRAAQTQQRASHAALQRKENSTQKTSNGSTSLSTMSPTSLIIPSFPRTACMRALQQQARGQWRTSACKHTRRQNCSDAQYVDYMCMCLAYNAVKLFDTRNGNRSGSEHGLTLISLSLSFALH